MTQITSLVDLAMAIQEGKDIEWLAKAPTAPEWRSIGYSGINFAGAIEHIEQNRFRIKPQIKKVDLSCLVGSGVLCEFGNDANNLERIGHLAEVKYTLYRMCEGSEVINCRPLFNYPHAFAEECLIPDGFVITIDYVDGTQDVGKERYRTAWGLLKTKARSFTITGYAEGWEG